MTNLHKYNSCVNHPWSSDRKTKKEYKTSNGNSNNEIDDKVKNPCCNISNINVIINKVVN